MNGISFKFNYFIQVMFHLTYAVFYNLIYQAWELQGIAFSGNLIS